MGNIVNLNQLVADAANNYILQNSEDFRSTVQGEQGIKGDQGDQGDSITVTGVVNNQDGSLIITFSDGYVHQTDVINGADGVDGDSVTITDVVNNLNGSLTLEFSDGYSHTTDILIGEQGVRGIQGISVHHLKGTSTTDPEGDFSTPGESDTYTMYGDADELINLGNFSIRNGDSAYTYAVEGGFTGTVEDFITTLGMIDDIVTTANTAVGIAQTHANDAAASAALAEKWAEEDEDVEVTVGKYSAHHWATKTETTTLAAQVVADSKLNITDITNDLNSISTVVPISALAGKTLNDAIVAINVLLASDDTTLDELQEIVTFIKANRADLDAITLDNITEGVTNKYFTAAEKLKLAGIEVAATGDQTAEEIETLYESTSDTNKYTDAEKVLVGTVAGKQEQLVNQTNIKSVNGGTLLGSGDLVIAAGSGGFAADLYFSNEVSAFNGLYRTLSYVPDVAPVVKQITCNNGETAGETYLFDLPIDTTVIDAGKWASNFYCSVDSDVGDTRIRIEGFMRATGGVETTLFTSTSPELTTVLDYVHWETTQPVFSVDATSIYGIRVFASTDSNSDKVVNYTVGDGNASYTNTPLATRHDQLRARDTAGAHPIEAITDLRTELDAKVSSSIFNEVEW